MLGCGWRVFFVNFAQEAGHVSCNYVGSGGNDKVFCIGFEGFVRKKADPHFVKNV